MKVSKLFDIEHSCLYDLSYIYPFTGLSFVLAALVSYFFLGEAVSINRWIGVAVICLGVYLVSIK